MNIENRNFYFKIDAANKKIKNYFQKKFDEAGIDLTVDQWLVLHHTAQNEGVNQKELSDIVRKDTATLTRIIDILVKKDILQRKNSEEDRRSFIISLTKNGKEIHDKTYEVVKEGRKKGWQNLSEEDFDNLVRIMETINANFDEV